MTFDEIRELEQRYHMQTYGRQPVAFVRGEGVRLWDTDGKEYLDFLSGIAVVSVGHSHPGVVAAVREQAGALTHVSNLFYTEPQVQLARRLHELVGWGKTFFANSGAEANEAALKLARKHAAASGRPCAKVVAALGSFHGRTFSTLAATGQPGKHAPFRPLPDWFTHVPLNDVAALRTAVDEETCAILLEVVQGEGGVRVADEAFLRAARELCDATGAVLIFDEVQTGLGRTGRWFGYQHVGVEPDVITLAKALGNGFPIGACIAREHIAAAFGPGDHGTTFGGGPVVSAAALAVLDAIEREDLCARAEAMGRRLREGVSAATANAGVVADVRGLGLLIAVQLAEPRAAEVVKQCLALGLVVNAVAPDAIRLAPPLVVGEEDVDRAVELLATVLTGATWSGA